MLFWKCVFYLQCYNQVSNIRPQQPYWCNDIALKLNFMIKSIAYGKEKLGMIFSSSTLAFFFGYNFHGMNAVMFSIGMFSYMCMALMPIFCRPDWPKKLIRRLPEAAQILFPAAQDACDNQSCTLVENSTTKTTPAKRESDDTGQTVGDQGTKTLPVKEREKENRASRKKIHARHWNWKHLFMNLICLHYIVVQLFLPYSHFLTKVRRICYCLKLY